MFIVKGKLIKKLCKILSSTLMFQKFLKIKLEKEAKAKIE